MADKIDHHWEYYTRSPSTTRYNPATDATLPPGHRYGYKGRRTRFTPKRRGYRAVCLCNWTCGHWHPSIRAMHSCAWHEHTEKLKAQGQLFGTDNMRPSNA